MQVAVAIPTFGRPGLLVGLLQHLENQKRPPDAVVISAPDFSHVPDYDPQTYRLSVVVGEAGLCAQRNRALADLLPWADVVTFFDDDFLPCDSYLERVVHLFTAMHDVGVIMGHVAVDGAQNAGLTLDEGLMALRAIQSSDPPPEDPTDQVGAYGCNMSIRTSCIGDARFDERLALYGWQEDIDFTGRLRRRGRVVRATELFGVHLGFKAGRVSGVRFGYSQVVNPTYLIRKGSIPATFGLKLMARNVIANVVRSFWPESHVDRWGRLKGNLIGALHIAGGRVEPEYIRQL